MLNAFAILIFETDGFGDGNENENIEEEEPPLSNVYVFERKPRTMNRVEVWLTLQCLVLRSKVSHARREHWRSASIGKYSKRRRSNVAAIIVRVVFISSFFFYCLLLNHSFQTNPNKITNCFQLILSITTLQLHCSCIAILIFE